MLVPEQYLLVLVVVLQCCQECYCLYWTYVSIRHSRDLTVMFVEVQSYLQGR